MPTFSITIPGTNGRKQVVDLYRCPFFYLDSDIVSFLRMASHYDKGILPEAGGLNDQPASFVYALEFYNAEINTYRIRQEREELKRGTS